MSNLRQVAQMALEALENSEDQLAKPYSTEASKSITALRAALAELVFDCPRCGHCCPQRKPLTDEEIVNLLPDDNTPMSLGEAFLKFARLIEAAHGIKVDA